MFGKRIIAGYGLDFIGANQTDKTTNINVTTSQFSSFDKDSTTSIVTSEISNYGFGPQLSLGYCITKNLIISTEFTLYFSNSSQKQNVFITRTIENSQQRVNVSETTTSSNSNPKTSVAKISFTLPVAIFLVLKF